MSSYLEGQTHQLVDALEAAGFTAGHITRIGQSPSLLKHLRMVLDGAAVINLIERPKPTPELTLDFTIRVDRSVRLAYPDWVGKVMHPDLECTGPAEYNLETAVEEWRHENQKTGVVRGQVIYDHLKAGNELANQLGLVDLLAIQAKGIKVFRALYKGKAVFGWKSVARRRGIRGGLGAPYLCGSDGRVVLYWVWLGSVWSSFSPALRFRK